MTWATNQNRAQEVYLLCGAFFFESENLRMNPEGEVTGLPVSSQISEKHMLTVTQEIIDECESKNQQMDRSSR